jgi:hypothetical protein
MWKWPYKMGTNGMRPMAMSMRVIHPVASWPANFLLVFILGRYKCNIVNEWMIWLNMYLINHNYLPLCKSCIIQFFGRFTTCVTDTVVHVMYDCMSTQYQNKLKWSLSIFFVLEMHIKVIHECNTKTSNLWIWVCSPFEHAHHSS